MVVDIMNRPQSIVSVRRGRVPGPIRLISKVLVPLVAAAIWTVPSAAEARGPGSFAAAKRVMENSIYAAAAVRRDVYCDCAYDARKNVDLASCGMSGVRGKRAGRIEWEHALPVSWARMNFACYREAPESRGGPRPDDESARSYCGRTDPEFSAMEADMHNLWPSVGRINEVRGADAYGIVDGEERQFGRCDFETAEGVAEPREAIRGELARSVLYMSQRYGIRLGASRQKLYEAWDRTDPPDAWEVERNRRIAKVQGNSNGFLDRHLERAVRR